MQILILQYALAVLTCLWWLKPNISIPIGKHLKVSFFNIFCLFALLFITCYSLINEVYSKNEPRELFTGIYLFLNIALFMIVPAGYLYLRFQLHHQPFRKKDFIHVLPSMLYIIFFVLPYFASDYQSFFVSWSLSSSAESITDNIPAILFTAYGYCVVGVYMVLVMKFLVERYFSFSRGLHIHAMSPGLAVTSDVIVSYGQPSEVQVGSIHFTSEQLANMDHTLRNLLLLKQPFLQHGYTLKQLSEDTGILLHHLSAFINQYYHIHFNDLINEYRVQYCQAKIRNEEWKYKTLEAIADESGFSNRNTFTAAFKKVTGCNPSDYLKLVKQQQQKTA